jgi:hypothetical protein
VGSRGKTPGHAGGDPAQHRLEVNLRLIRLLLMRYRLRSIRKRLERQRLLTGKR